MVLCIGITMFCVFYLQGTQIHLRYKQLRMFSVLAPYFLYSANTGSTPTLAPNCVWSGESNVRSIFIESFTSNKQFIHGNRNGHQITSYEVQTIQNMLITLGRSLLLLLIHCLLEQHCYEKSLC